jgi:riboflavin synthase
MTARKFYKTVITVEVLSEEPYDETDLSQVSYDITEGHHSGVVKITSNEELTGKQAADELKAQGSDTDFFLLDENGDDVEENEDWI